MRTHLMSLGVEVSQFATNRHEVPSFPPIDQDGKKAYVSHSKDMNSILSVFPDSKFVNIMQCELASKMWDKLVSNHEVDDKVKKSRPQTF